MRLKSIEMQGFKSFADKIYLDFNPGITAIVGPNGSGKSNISDAIRWVMGEQSAKSLRGSKMEDVIFSGTEARKPLGFAEVTLVLDNSDHYFSLDFPEITVTRRVYRSGEGEYYINKTLCRLKDVHELFMDTGLGRDGYSIIGQGKIDNILSTKSEDRRQIFEEAAGISKYKYRKLEAERKLTQATDNLTRVEDILGELESRLDPLRHQSEKARKYLTLRDEMRGLDITVSVIQSEKAKAELKTLRENLNLLNTQIDGIKEDLSDTENEIASMYDRMEEYDKEISACREADQTSLSTIHEAKNKMTVLLSDIDHNQQNITRLEQEVQAGMDAIRKIDEVLSSYTKNLLELDVQNQGVMKSLEELTEESKQTGKDASEKNDTLESMKNEIIDLLASINSIDASCKSLEMIADNFRERQVAMEDELKQKLNGKESLISHQEEIAKLHTQCIQDITEQREKIEKMEREVSLDDEKIRSIAEKRNQQILSMNQKQSRKKMLLDMEREFDGYARGVKCVMTALRDGKLSGAKIYGPLSQLIKTDQKYIIPVETALGSVGQNIVTEQEEDAQKAISYLKNEKEGRATFLPVSAIKGRDFEGKHADQDAGFLAIASDVVKCEKKYEDIVSSFLGNTVICDTLDHAISMAKKHKHKFRIVTLDGDVIQAGGAMTGGSKSRSTGSLSRAGEIELLTTEVAELEKTIETMAKEQESYVSALESKKQSIKDDSVKLQNLQSELVRLDTEKRHQEELLSGVLDAAKQAEKERDDILSRLADIEREKAEKTAEIAEKKAICTSLEQQISAVQKEYSTLSGKNELLISKLTELNLSRNTILKDMELEQDRISRLNTEKAHYLEDITAKNGGIQMLRDRNNDINDEVSACKTQIASLEQALTEYRTNLETLSQNRIRTENEVREKQDSIKDVQEQMFSLTQQQSKMESKAEKYEDEIETIVNRLLEEYELPYSEAVAMKREEDFDFKEASTRIRQLRDQIRALGNINIDAIEEYKNIKERFDFLSIQASDLKKAKGELEEVIEEMLTIMQSRF